MYFFENQLFRWACVQVSGKCTGITKLEWLTLCFHVATTYAKAIRCMPSSRTSGECLLMINDN